MNSDESRLPLDDGSSGFGVTHRQIAAKTGFSQSGVSLALRGDPRISEATKARIQDAAAAMGYRPDPSMAVLSACRHGRRTVGDHGKLAILNGLKLRAESMPLYFKLQIEGVRERAKQLGYETEVFDVPADAREQRRLGRMLAARGIRGVVVGSMEADQPSLDIDWRPFAAVALGYSLLSPQLHYVASNHLTTVTTMYERLHALGYRKIGYFHNEIAEKRGQHLYIAAYFKRLFIDGVLPGSCEPLMKADFPESLAWLKRYDFDAVISGHGHVRPWLAYLKKDGWRVPNDLGVAVIAPLETDTDLAGVRENMHELGIAAVSLLHTMLISGERGVPVRRHSIMVDGAWQLGETVRSLLVV